MSIAIQELFQAFPGYEIAITPRPDGMLLLCLKHGDADPLRKAIDGDVVFCEQRVRRVIRELTRDLKLAAGEVSWKGEGNQWVRAELPTFTGDAIHFTAAKTLFARRAVRRPGQALADAVR